MIRRTPSFAAHAGSSPCAVSPSLILSLAVVSAAPRPRRCARRPRRASSPRAATNVEVTPPDAPLPRCAAVRRRAHPRRPFARRRRWPARVALCQQGRSSRVAPGASLVLFTSGDAPLNGAPRVDHHHAGVRRRASRPRPGSPTLPLSLGATTVHRRPRARHVGRRARGDGACPSTRAAWSSVRAPPPARSARGQGTREAPMGPRAPIATLPGAPRGVSPRPRASPPRRRRPVFGDLRRARRRRGWRVELARDPSFAGSRRERRVNGREGRWRAASRAVARGSRARVAVDALGLEGPPSPPARFTIETPGIIRARPRRRAPRAAHRAPRARGRVLRRRRRDLAQMPGDVRLQPARAITSAARQDAEDARAGVHVGGGGRAAPARRCGSARRGLVARPPVRLAPTRGPAHPLRRHRRAARGRRPRLNELREASERRVYTAPVRWSTARPTLISGSPSTAASP